MRDLAATCAHLVRALRAVPHALPLHPVILPRHLRLASTRGLLRSHPFEVASPLSILLVVLCGLAAFEAHGVPSRGGGEDARWYFAAALVAALVLFGGISRLPFATVSVWLAGFAGVVTIYPLAFLSLVMPEVGMPAAGVVALALLATVIWRASMRRAVSAFIFGASAWLAWVYISLAHFYGWP